MVFKRIRMNLAHEFHVLMGHCIWNLLFILAKQILFLHSAPVPETCLFSLHTTLKLPSLIQWALSYGKNGLLVVNTFRGWATESLQQIIKPEQRKQSRPFSGCLKLSLHKLGDHYLSHSNIEAKEHKKLVARVKEGVNRYSEKSRWEKEK